MILGPVYELRDKISVNVIHENGQDGRSCQERDKGPLPVFDMAAYWLEIYFGGGIPDSLPGIPGS